MCITAKIAFIPDRQKMAKSVIWEMYRQPDESILKYVYCKPCLGSPSILSVGWQTYGETRTNTFTQKKETAIFSKNIKFRVCLSTYEFCEASLTEKNNV